MSYDLGAFRLPPGVEPGDDESDWEERAPTAKERAEMERLAEAVVAAPPRVRPLGTP